MMAALLLCAVAARADYEAGRAAWDAGRHVEAVREWRAAAQENDARAMLALGRAFVKGLGVLQDFVEAHKWLNLAAGRGSAEAATERDALAKEMTAAERAAARKLARAWRSGEAGTAAVRPSAEPARPAPPPARALREAQTLLTALGYKPGAPDGKWGKRSIRAYRDFLRDAGMQPADVLTPAALRVMRKAAANRRESIPVKRTAKLAPDLHRIVRAGDTDGLNKALANTGVNVNARDARGWTPLMHAVDKGYTLLVPSLLKAGADPNIRLADGATALFMAVIHGQSEVVAAMVKAGGDPAVRGPKGKTAEDLARISKNMDLIKAVGLIETIPLKQAGGQLVSHCIKVRKEREEQRTWAGGQPWWVYRWNLKNVCDETVHVNYCLDHLNPSDARADNSEYTPHCKTGRRARWAVHRPMILDPNEEKVASGPGSSGEWLGRRRKLLFGACENEKGYRTRRIDGTRNYKCVCYMEKGCPSIRRK